MNKYTKKEMFTESADYILDNSDLLIADNCIIYNDVVYERLTDCEHQYRFFFSVDNYDYLEDKHYIAALDELFSMTRDID